MTRTLLLALLLGCTHTVPVDPAVEANAARADTLAAELEVAWAAAEDAQYRCAHLPDVIADLRRSIRTQAQAIDQMQWLTDAARHDRSELAEDLTELQLALASAQAHRLAALDRVSEQHRVLSSFQPLADAGALDTRVVQGRIVLSMPSEVLFASGSADLSAQGRASLDEVAAVLQTLPGRRFQVEGHTDDLPAGSAGFDSNWHLGAARSIEVVTHLVGAGVAPEQLSAATYGEHAALTTNDTPGRRARNRRVEIVLQPDLSGLPGYDTVPRSAM